MNSTNFIIKLLQSFTEALQQLELFLQSLDSFEDLLKDLGWEIGDTITFDQVTEAFKGFIENLKETILVQQILIDLENESDPIIIAQKLEPLITTITGIVSTIKKLKETNNASWPAPLNQNEFWNSFPEELIDYLIYEKLANQKPILFAVLLNLGLLSKNLVDPGITHRKPYYKRQIQWEQIGHLLKQPQNLLKDLYGWGSDFRFNDFSSNFITLFSAFGLQAHLFPPEADLLAKYYDPENPIRKEVTELIVALYETVIDDGVNLETVWLELVILPVPLTKDNPKLSGFVMFLRGKGNLEVAPLSLGQFTKINLSGNIAANPIHLQALPGLTQVSIEGKETDIKALAQLGFTPPNPIILLGDKNSSRLEIASTELSLTVSGKTAEEYSLDYKIEFGTDGLNLVMKFAEADSFISKFFGSGEESIKLNLTLAWSIKGGLSIAGLGVQTSITIPVNRNLGLVKIDNLELGFSAYNEGISFIVGLTGGFNLGPFTVVVEEVGIQFALVPHRDGARNVFNFGNIDLTFGFKPPKGLGLALDIAVIKGGGYLFFDPDNAQYAGTIQLEIKGIISLVAVGLLTTRMPDGSKGFSLLVIITAEFPPIQLGFGFTLNGLGGLLGVNRTTEVEVLREGLKNHTLESVLFPKDVISNAPRIISDLRSAFPPAEGRFVFGPMAKLGWGTPPILTIELGILIELPAPVRIMLLGRLKLALPGQDIDPILVWIQADILGVIDLGRQEISFDAALLDSRIGPYGLSGDIALRLRWGSNPTFLFSAGGYHPQFKPPSDFPQMRRIAVTLGTGNNPRVRLEAYFAITSNTIQFGARLDFYFKAGPLSLEGFLAFDALFHFSPFEFNVHIGAALALKSNGKALMALYLELELSGPNPWRVAGRAEFEILFFSVSISVDHTFNDAEAQPELAVANVLEELTQALKEKNSWSTQPPENALQLVSLRKDEKFESENPETLLLHPLSQLSVRQRVVPLNYEIERYGNSIPQQGERSFSIDQVMLNSQPVQTVNLEDLFAPAQFKNLSDQQKLDSPAFVLLEAGMQISLDNEFRWGDEEQDELSFTTIIIGKSEDGTDDNWNSREGDDYQMSAETLETIMLAGSAKH